VGLFLRFPSIAPPAQLQTCDVIAATGAEAAAVNVYSRKESPMLLAIALVLFVLWLLGFLVFHVSSGLIHLVLVIAIIVGLVHLFQGRRM
jgi:uncharacterized protein DUF5670